MTATTVPPSFTIGLAGWKTTIVTVDVPATTKFREPGQTSPGLGGVLVGDNVSVSGTQAGAGIVDALSVNVPLALDAGTVATPPPTGATPPTSFTITTAAGKTVTVEVSSTTTFHVLGQSSPGLGDVAVSDHVLVVGTQGGTGVVGATSVLILPASTGHGFPGFPGGRGHGHGR
jgi:hypothetical protein